MSSSTRPPRRPNPDSDPSPWRRLRIPGTVWSAAWRRAEREGRSLHAVARELLRRYAAGEIDAGPAAGDGPPDPGAAAGQAPTVTGTAPLRGTAAPHRTDTPHRATADTEGHRP